MEPQIINLPARLSDTNLTLVVPERSANNFQLPPAEGLLKRKPFIVANTQDATLSHLQKDCIIPVFAKDNESTISHHQFIEAVYECVKVFFCIPAAPIDIRVSHVIKGRIPSAIGKPAAALADFEKTQYYERMAFIIEVKQHSALVGGNPLVLQVGGIRAYNHENLYGRKSMEKFKVFVGYKNLVCMNMCVSTDGLKAELRASNTEELAAGVLELLASYNRHQHLAQLAMLEEYQLSEHQFAQLIGKSKLYQHLDARKKRRIPELLFNDTHISAVAKEYYGDEHFRGSADGSINLWKVYNLFTSANKSSYIDSFLSRSVNAFDFATGIRKALDGQQEYQWYLG